MVAPVWILVNIKREQGGKKREERGSEAEMGGK